MILTGTPPRADIALEKDSTVSPLHAELRYRNGAWWLIDADSVEGTFLLVEDAGAQWPVHSSVAHALPRLRRSALASEVFERRARIHASARRCAANQKGGRSPTFRG